MSARWQCKICKRGNRWNKYRCTLCNTPKHEVKSQDRTLEERLFDNRKIDREHWIWTGYVNSSGHGVIRVDNKTYLVHRISAHLYLGLDLKSNEQYALHKIECSIPSCFNHIHLYIGTSSQNAYDRWELERGIVNVNRK